MIDAMRRAAAGSPSSDLLDGLFGPTRSLYKRVAQCSLFQHAELYERLARRPYPWLVRCAERFAELASSELGQPIASHEVLFDAPPMELEVEFQIDVHFPKENVYRKLGDVSPVVKTLAREQFDDYVKRVRLFAHPRIAQKLRDSSRLIGLIAEAVDETT